MSSRHSERSVTIVIVINVTVTTVNVSTVREAVKKCSFILGIFHKGGGAGVQANPKVLGHFLSINNFLKILGIKRGGGDWPNLKVFFGTFSPNFW